MPIPTPNINPPTIELCDNTTAEVLEEKFNLATYKNLILNGSTTDILSYYVLQSDAVAGTNAIPNLLITEYPTTGINNSVWIRVVSSTATTLTNCAIVFEQKLLTVPIPTPNINPPTIELCDDLLSGDLKETFNLATYESIIRAGNSTYIFSYFPTKTDAENSILVNKINNFGAYFSPTASVWIRVVSNTPTTLQTCAIVIEQKLQVNPLPLAGPINILYACKNPGSTKATFNLNDRDIAALAGQNNLNFSITYHLFLVEAKNGTNPLPFIYDSVSKVIFASVKNNSTGCRNTAALQLIAETTTTATNPAASATFICDTDSSNDGFTNFTLSDLNRTILTNSQPAATYSVNYYASQAALDNNIPIDQNNYTNLTNPQIIIANVINTASNVVPKKCAAQIYIVLNVSKLPITNPKDGFVCYDLMSGNLLSNYTIDSELNSAVYNFEWFLNSSTTPIVGATNSTYSVTDGGDYTVVATLKTHPFCKSLPKKITVIKSEPALATARVEYSFTDNLNVITIVTGLGKYVFQLDNEAIQTSNLFENVAPGTHNITVIDENGCASVILSVIVLDYVRYFTPNEDGYNDKWNIKGIKYQPNAKVYIFDRFEKLLKQLSTSDEGWDGTYLGNMLPSDDYWFTVTYEENGEQKQFKSHFAMKR